MKLLNMTKRQILITSLCAVVVGIGFIVAIAAATANTLQQAEQQLNKNADTVQAETPATATQDRPETAQTAETTVEPTTQVTQPQQAQITPQQKTEPVDGGHVPFTNKDVTPGQPETYVDTVGQCPFYEMAGDKGCVPPSDIVCNADWTKCEPAN